METLHATARAAKEELERCGYRLEGSPGSVFCRGQARRVVCVEYPPYGEKNGRWGPQGRTDYRIVEFSPGMPLVVTYRGTP